MTSDAQIDRLVEALRSAGAPEPQPPADASSLAALEGELAPLRLPETLRRLWQRIDVRSLALDTYPRLSDPDFALFGWRLNRDGVLSVPLSMLPFCYESHNHLLIELEDGEDAGGTIFEWGFGDGSLRIRFAGLEDWLAVLVAALDEGSFERHDAWQAPACWSTSTATGPWRKRGLWPSAPMPHTRMRASSRSMSQPGPSGGSARPLPSSVSNGHAARTGPYGSCSTKLATARCTQPWPAS